jgi:hypothetical protein
MKRAEVRPDDAPVELLSEQRQVDQVEQRRLQLVSNLLP